MQNLFISYEKLFDFLLDATSADDLLKGLEIDYLILEIVLVQIIFEVEVDQVVDFSAHDSVDVDIFELEEVDYVKPAVLINVEDVVARPEAFFLLLGQTERD